MSKEGRTFLGLKVLQIISRNSVLARGKGAHTKGATLLKILGRGNNLDITGNLNSFT